jgi:hypothetical protein
MNSAEDQLLEDVLRSRLTPQQFAEWQRRRANAAAAEVSHPGDPELQRMIRALGAAGYRVDVEVTAKVPWRQGW